jgi:hypothetical protein
MKNMTELTDLPSTHASFSSTDFLSADFFARIIAFLESREATAAGMHHGSAEKSKAPSEA